VPASPQAKLKARARLLSKYGLTLDDFARMMADQGGGCWICFRPPKKASLHVDHNHKTGAVRGLLCGMCNRKLIGIIERLQVPPERLLAYCQLFGITGLSREQRAAKRTR
jgi:hypothetical protein